MTARERLENNEINADEIMLFDEEAFNESLIGTTESDGFVRAVYDYGRMVEEYAEFHQITPEDAADHICYNIIRGLPYLGEKAPIIIDLFFEERDHDAD